MPNHIINSLKAPAEVLAALDNKDGNPVDFAQVIPHPEGFKEVTAYAGPEGLAKLICGQLKLNPEPGDFLGALQLSNVLRDLDRGGLKKYSDEEFETFVSMLRNFRLSGFLCWYDWQIEKWGTKWNAYEPEARDGLVRFQTAWSAPHPVILKLTDMFPEACIEHQWADEDTGSNLGSRIYHKGRMVEGSIADPVAFALDLWDYDEDRRKCYVPDPVTGLLKYDESKDD